MRALLVALILASLALAGCTGDGEQETPPPTTTPPTTPPPVTTPPEPVAPVEEFALMSNFEFLGCSGVRVNAPVDYVAAQSLLPEGYTAVADATVPATLPEAKQATVTIHLFNCTNFNAGAFAFETVWFGMASIPVDAPADGTTADSHAYVVEMIGGEDVLAAIWPVAGYPTFNGTTESTDLPAARDLTAGDYSLESTKVIPNSLGNTGSFAWYHELDSGDRLLWTGDRDVPGATGGAGTVFIPGESALGPVDASGEQTLAGVGAATDDASFTGMNLILQLAEYRD